MSKKKENKQISKGTSNKRRLGNSNNTETIMRQERDSSSNQKGRTNSNQN